MGHGDNCKEHDLPHPCDLCRIEDLEAQILAMNSTSHNQISILMERCKQLETVNSTQWLLINNMEKKIRELIVSDALKTEQLVSLEQRTVILREITDKLMIIQQGY